MEVKSLRKNLPGDGEKIRPPGKMPSHSALQGRLLWGFLWVMKHTHTHFNLFTKAIAEVASSLFQGPKTSTSPRYHPFQPSVHVKKCHPTSLVGSCSPGVALRPCPRMRWTFLASGPQQLGFWLPKQVLPYLCGRTKSVDSVDPQEVHL